MGVQQQIDQLHRWSQDLTMAKKENNRLLNELENAQEAQRKSTVDAQDTLAQYEAYKKEVEAQLSHERERAANFERDLRASRLQVEELEKNPPVSAVDRDALIIQLRKDLERRARSVDNALRLQKIAEDRCKLTQQRLNEEIERQRNLAGHMRNTLDHMVRQMPRGFRSTSLIRASRISRQRSRRNRRCRPTSGPARETSPRSAAMSTLLSSISRCHAAPL